MKRFPFFLLLAFSFYFVSCKPLEKIPAYLENVNDSTGKGTVKQAELIIQKNDLLSIQIASLSTKPEISDAIFNQQVIGGTSVGYLVDGNGNIEHHRLGIIRAAGLTKDQLAAEIKKRLTDPAELMKDPSVIIRFMNMKVTVLGEVGQQGPVNVPGEKLTILEAVGLAGGITEYGKKTTIKVLRETNGQRETAVVDLTSKDIFDSPYYNLVQNDVIIVEATRRKMDDLERTRNFQKITLGVTLVTVTATLTNLIFRN